MGWKRKVSHFEPLKNIEFFQKVVLRVALYVSIGKFVCRLESKKQAASYFSSAAAT